MIARELDIRIIDTVCVSSYAWQDQGQSTLLKGFQDISGDQGRCLVIDDLTDTGRTVRMVRQMLPGAVSAACPCGFSWSGSDGAG